MKLLGTEYGRYRAQSFFAHEPVHVTAGTGFRVTERGRYIWNILFLCMRYLDDAPV